MKEVKLIFSSDKILFIEQKYFEKVLQMPKAGKSY